MFIHNYRNLKSLCLRRCNNIQGESLPVLIDNCSSLTSLVLDGTSVSDEAVTPVRWERSIITEVDLSWCRNITQDGLKSMLPRCRFLRYLRLCCCGYVEKLNLSIFVLIIHENLAKLNSQGKRKTVGVSSGSS